MALRLSEGLTYPFRGDRPTDLFAIGGLLGLTAAISLQLGAVLATSTLLLALPFVGLTAIPVVAVLGYLLRVFRTTATGDDTPPGFQPLRSLFRPGWRLLVVSVGYAVLLTVAIGVPIGGLVWLPLPLDSIGLAGSMLFFGVSTITLCLALAIGYTYPVVVGRLADGTRLVDAIDVRLHRPVLAHGGYCLAWTVAALVVVPGWAFLVAALSSPTAFGVFAVFVTFYAHVVATRIVARGYRTASASSSLAGTTDDE